MSHMSVLGACWVQAYFEKEVYFGRMPIFGEGYFEERPIFGKEDLILEQATGGKKETCRKRRKSSMQEEKQHGEGRQA
jgi:hypothetical protein